MASTKTWLQETADRIEAFVSDVKRAECNITDLYCFMHKLSSDPEEICLEHRCDQCRFWRDVTDSHGAYLDVKQYLHMFNNAYNRYKVIKEEAYNAVYEKHPEVSPMLECLLESDERVCLEALYRCKATLEHARRRHVAKHGVLQLMTTADCTITCTPLPKQ